MSDKAFLEALLPPSANLLLPSKNIPTLMPSKYPTISTSTWSEDLSDDEFNGDKLILFLDSEWNVEISDRGYLAYKDQIYVIQFGQMLAGNGLPVQLKNILLNPHILKVGQAVSGDLKYLRETCQSNEPFVAVGRRFGRDIFKLMLSAICSGDRSVIPTGLGVLRFKLDG
ncbi:hypothetical protein B0H14DRAFT_3646418 [Mycena olivaceomarginata]|nr:hypothetical protein B0H14DRAFT_3646418 [Mycena olivaceomarginata]